MALATCPISAQSLHWATGGWSGRVGGRALTQVRLCKGVSSAAQASPAGTLACTLLSLPFGYTGERGRRECC